MRILIFGPFGLAAKSDLPADVFISIIRNTIFWLHYYSGLLCIISRNRCIFIQYFNEYINCLQRKKRKTFPGEGWGFYRRNSKIRILHQDSKQRRQPNVLYDFPLPLLHYKFSYFSFADILRRLKPTSLIIYYFGDLENSHFWALWLSNLK